jgi:bifunctional UDP-N-acetylglucosamine pyrophosphorylase/glucosamine-1-phosphate N-acetyltransferase
MDKICCIVLAAGAGKRMGGDLPKAIVQTREKALIDHLLDALQPLKPARTIVVAGHQQDLLKNHLSRSPSAAGHSIEIAIQDQQLGTGHAVRCALPALKDFKGTVLITYADHPLFTADTLALFASYHAFKKATVTMLSFKASPPNFYGRVIRDSSGNVLRITEAKDCTPEEALVSEANSGFYAVDSSFLKPAVEALTNNNAQGEYYLTDIVEKASKEGQTVAAFALANATEAAGVNTPQELAAVNTVLMEREIHNLQGDGVNFVDPKSCFIDAGIKIGNGTTLGPNVQLRGATSIGEGVCIEGTAIIKDSSIAAQAIIKLGCHIEGAVIGEGTSVGPFAHVRPGTKLGAHVRVGNFVETKNATLQDGAKASHLSYLGDCSVGKDTNIGAGTITCNYDGYRKATTSIGENVFIGSNSALVAPVKIGSGALIAAGSVVTHDVPPDALGIARAKQENKAGWEKARRASLESAKHRSS